MANVRDLVADISEHRQRLDQTFFDHIRQLRHEHGDRAVDEALATLRKQREAVAVTKGLATGAPRPRNISGNFRTT